MRFLVDCQLPRALAERLRQAGHSADHVADVGLRGAPDRAIWQHAIDNQSTIVTKDEDFSLLATSTVSGPSVVWVRLGNTRNDILWKTIETMLPTIVAAITAGGERLIEIR